MFGKHGVRNVDVRLRDRLVVPDVLQLDLGYRYSLGDGGYFYPEVGDLVPEFSNLLLTALSSLKVF